MFSTFFLFELRLWTRSTMLYVFLFIISLLIGLATGSENVQVGGALSNTHRNAPWVVQNFYGVISVLAILMTTAFANSAASRDFAYNTHQILFTTPMSKLGYLLGRFFGATIAALIPQLGVSLGIIFATLFVGGAEEKWGPTYLLAHLNAVLIFAIPNTILISAIIFSIAVVTRSTLTSYLGALGILIGYGVAGLLIADIENERIGSLVDPFGISAFRIYTKYWTVADKNTMYVSLQGMILQNRILWTTVGLLILAVACRLFSFTTGKSRSKEKATEDTNVALPTVVLPTVTIRQGTLTSIQQFARVARTEFFETARSTVFMVVMVGAILNMIISLLVSASEGFGVSAMPVTYQMIDVIRGSLYLFLISLITFYSGNLVWKERDARLDEIHDALPYPTWISYAAKFSTMIGLLVIILSISIAISVAIQALNGYTRFQLWLYATDLLVNDMVLFIALTVLAMFSHVVSPNRYIGYFLFIILVVVNAFAWRFLEVENLLVAYGDRPSYVYSDLFGFAPYSTALIWYSLYWLAVSTLLSCVAILLWQRGRETSWAFRVRQAPTRLVSGLRLVAIKAVIATVALAGWIHYNTRILNEYTSSAQVKLEQVAYEKSFKKFENLAQPRIVDVRYNIDLKPETREMVMSGIQTLVNKTFEPIPQIHFTLSNSYETKIVIEGAKLQEDLSTEYYQIYQLEKPLGVGESIVMQFTVESHPRGFQQSLDPSEIVQNGTFFNNSIAPQIGYQPNVELQDADDREDNGLPKVEPIAELQRDCTVSCQNNYLSNNSDWVNIETIISTSPDQIAVAPGSLIRQWEENGRKYFHYKVDHPSVNFYSFISARYAVERKKWNDIDVEVYYHPEHAWNVQKMVSAVEQSLDYYTKNFGPYKHKQARIIEFPRTAEFAQAFPGTMPYSEGIGFIADLNDSEEIDKVYYVVAHEMAHQWWAHQVIGANMEGATILSETLAQYSALMVMEKQYGRDMMRKFLKYEMDRYLASRGRETLKERPLQKVEPSQGYVHYQKGSVVMYHLKEIIGEEKLNAALRELLDQYAYKGPPYPTSYALLDALRLQVPDEHLHLLKDMFEQITLYANRCDSATYKKLSNGKFEVTLKVNCEKYVAGEKGEETAVPAEDWIEIGAFARPEPGKKFGATLYRQRERIKSGTATFKFVLDELPHTAGIDPFALLVDRQPEDNIKRVEAETP